MELEQKTHPPQIKSSKQFGMIPEERKNGLDMGWQILQTIHGCKSKNSIRILDLYVLFVYYSVPEDFSQLKEKLLVGLWNIILEREFIS